MVWLKSCCELGRGEYFIMALRRCKHIWAPQIQDLCRKTVGLGLYHRNPGYSAQGPDVSILAGSVI